MKDNLLSMILAGFIMGAFFGTMAGYAYNEGEVYDYKKDVQLACVHTNRLKIDEYVYSCQWLKGVEMK